MVIGKWTLLVSCVVGLAGCASTPAANAAKAAMSSAGLSNAPKLGTTAGLIERPYDVIANGPDSCVEAPSANPPIYAHSPPCPAYVAPAPKMVPPPSAAPSRTWVAPSRFAFPACDTPESSADAVVMASCCPTDAPACGR